MGGEVSEREGPEEKKCREFHHLLMSNLTTGFRYWVLLQLLLAVDYIYKMML